METKNILVFLAGAAVAYFVIKEMDKQKAKTAPPTPVPPIDQIPVPPIDEVDENAICEEALNTQLMTMRFTSETEREAFIQDYSNNCLRGDSGEPPYQLNTGCPEGQVRCTIQPVGGAVKCYNPNAIYELNPCA
jgi:hypothetical protein